MNSFRWVVNECSSWTDPLNGNEIQYCIKHTGSHSSTEKTVYAFHGMGGDAPGFCDHLTANIQLFRDVGTISHVVCPSFGPNWVIHENHRDESFSRFRRMIQQQYSASHTQLPVLYGVSMGGFNALKASGRPYASELEKRVAGLERLLGRKTEEVEILKEAVRISREKKLISRQPLPGLENFE